MSRLKHSSFEERLARLRQAESRAIPEPAAPPAAPSAPAHSRLTRRPAPELAAAQPAPAAPAPATPPRRAPARAMLAAGLALMAGALSFMPGDDRGQPYVQVALAAFLPGSGPMPAPPGPDEAAPVAPATPDGVAPPPAPVGAVAQADAPQVGLIDRLMAMLSGTPADPPAISTLPADYLPPAPAGWLRLTGAEAAAPDALERLLADWALLPPGAVALAESRGFTVLEQFLIAPPQTADEARLRAQAVYLAPDGDYLLVTLRFRPALAAFGRPGDEGTWTKALQAEVKRNAGDTELVETLKIGGLTLFNRTRPEGKSRLNRPVGKDFDTPNGLKLTTALSHRAEAQANGHAAPAVAGALLAAIDRKALAALPD